MNPSAAPAPADPFLAPVQFLKGVGPARAALLGRLGVRTVGELLYLFPRRYADRRTVTPLEALSPGGPAVVQGRVRRVRASRSARRGLGVVEVTLEDGRGGRAALVWFNQPYRSREFSPGDWVVAAGKAGPGPRPALRVEEFELLEEGEAALHAAGLVPVYPSTDGLGSRRIRAWVRAALERAGGVPDPLPEAVRARRGLAPAAEALRALHAPRSPEEAQAARRRFAYEEFFLLQARLALKRRAAAAGPPAARVAVGRALDFRIRALFPFSLTGAQERAVVQIRADLASGRPMSRLLQGDVGSGKTVVAAYALLAAVGNRVQAALMAPTEVLAEQHARTFGRLLARSRVRTAVLSGSLPAPARAAARAAVAAGEVDLVIGTHAVIAKEVAFRKLGLAVIDEQHRFGVLQRAELAVKGPRPHVLVMSATPIPRTLALTAYGDLDVTVLDEMPPGRREVRTVYVPASGRRAAYAFIRERLREGRQAYFVCPLVDDSDRTAPRSAVRLHAELREVFRDFRVALLHGRLPAGEKERAMEEFRSGRAHALVSTIVIEVGVDVPNASVMVIDGCERYGLAQLHQLRGRIGRGSHPSVCFLFGRRTERVAALAASADGFRIAEEDLRLRGPGEAGGLRQSGPAPFRAAELPADAAILEQAREDAFAWVRTDPRLRGAPALRAALARGGPADARFLHVG